MHLIRKATPLFIVASGLAWLTVSPLTEAVVPPPDGGYPNFNTAEGEDALFKLTGGYNTAVGWFSLWSNTAVSLNTAIGAALRLANTANENMATGAVALIHNSTGSTNTAVGDAALEANTTGISNTAIGAFALQASLQPSTLRLVSALLSRTKFS